MCVCSWTYFFVYDGLFIGLKYLSLYMVLVNGAMSSDLANFEFI